MFPTILYMLIQSLMTVTMFIIVLYVLDRITSIRYARKYKEYKRTCIEMLKNIRVDTSQRDNNT